MYRIKYETIKDIPILVYYLDPYQINDKNITLFKLI